MNCKFVITSLAADCVYFMHNSLHPDWLNKGLDTKPETINLIVLYS